MVRRFKSAAWAGALALLLCVAARGQIVTGGNGTATSVTVSTVTTGTSFGVSGAVSPDRRYVGVNVDVQFSTLQGIDTFTVGPGGATVGGAGRASMVRGIAGAGVVPGRAPQVMAIPQMPPQNYGVSVPFRPAQFGRVMIVDHDKPLLAAKVKAASLKGISLKGAMRKLADVTNENIVLGTNGLAQANVDINALHDFDIPAGTVEEALLAILKTGAAETDMVITSEEKVLQVITQGQADKTIITKTYYLEDLVANIPRYVAANTDMGQLGGKPGEKSTATKPARPASASTNIVELITSTVRPEIWKVNGGKYGEISCVGHIVTVRAPQSVQALLDGPKVYNPNAVPLYVQYSQ